MSIFGSRRQSETDEPEQQPRSEPPTTKLPQPSVGFDTVLGSGSIIEGTLRSKANVRLDGEFTGTLEITGNVLVGETAKITADINAQNISIAGAVRGNVFGKKVQLLRTGRIWGDINATALTTEEGAFIDGKISMVSHEATSQIKQSVVTDSAVEAVTETEPFAAEAANETADDDVVDVSVDDDADDTNDEEHDID